MENSEHHVHTHIDTLVNFHSESRFNLILICLFVLNAFSPNRLPVPLTMTRMDDFRPMMDPTTHSDVDHAFQSQMLTDLSTDIEAPAPPPIINSSGFHSDTAPPSSVPSDQGQSMFEATAAAIAAVTAVDDAADGSATDAAVANNNTYSMLPSNEISTYVEPIQEQQPAPSPQQTTTDSTTVNENVVDAPSTNTDPTPNTPSNLDPATVDDENKKDTAESSTDKIEGDNNDSTASKADGTGDSDGKDNDKNNDNGKDEEDDDEQNDDSTSQLRELRREEDIDPNQCRVCMTNANLLDIFRIGERTSFRICDLIMKLAPSVKISERDYLPHSICSVCVDRIEGAYELRIQCEKTDELLRSKLKRSKKTTRRAPAEFLLVDANAESSESDDDQKSDDEEFKLSEASEESSESESSDSSYDEKKKRTTNQRGGGFKRGGGAPLKRGGVQVMHQPMKKPRTAGVVYIKAVKSDDDGATTTRKPGPKSSKGPIKAGPNNRLAFRCDICNRPCSSAETLAQHRRIHTDEKCGICSMIFKNKAALIQHMQRHKDDPDRVCKKCHRVFVTKAECQRHIQTAHAETVACQRCRRYFPNRAQLDTHKCMADRKTMDVKPRKSDVQTSGSGQDLFKSVAPLTTTYWSDSFSD